MSEVYTGILTCTVAVETYPISGCEAWDKLASHQNDIKSENTKPLKTLLKPSKIPHSMPLQRVKQVLITPPTPGKAQTPHQRGTRLYSEVSTKKRVV